MFVPKTAEQYAREILGVWYTFTGGVDISEGSPDALLAESLGLVLETFDARLRALAEAHGLNARGADLDARVAEIMSGAAISRGGATAASSPAMGFSREDATLEQVIPAGAVFRSRADGALAYRLDEAVTLSPGQFVFPAPGQLPARATCTTPGSAGNVRALGLVTEIVSGVPSGVAASNVAEITGGVDEESDESLSQRARLLISAIAKSQPSAIEGLASRFVSSDGVAIRHARVYEPPEAPGFAELVVSDGFGLSGFERPAELITGVAGPAGTRTIRFDGPAASEPRLVIDYDPDVQFESQGAAAGSYPSVVVLHERGVIELVGGAALAPGTVYAVGGHTVYTGPIAELQARIEGSYRAGEVTDYGWRAAGCRVRVRPTIPVPLAYRVKARFRPGVNIPRAQAALASLIVEWQAAQPLNAEISHFRLVDEAAKLRDLEDFSVLSPTDRLSPPSDRHQFVTTPALITFV